MRKGKLIKREFTMNHWIEVVKGKIFYWAYILDKKRNTQTKTKFFMNFDDCFDCALNMIDDFSAHGDYHFSYWNDEIIKEGKDKQNESI